MFNREKPQYIEDSKVRYTLREMKKNASVYVLLAPYFILFTIFTIIPVLLSLPMGFTNFNMVQFPQFVGLSNFYSLILEDEVFLKAIQNTLVRNYNRSVKLYHVLYTGMAYQRNAQSIKDNVHIYLLCADSGR